MATYKFSVPKEKPALDTAIWKTVDGMFDIVETPISKVTYSNKKPRVTKPATKTFYVARIVPNEKLALNAAIQKTSDGMFDIIEKPISKIDCSDNKSRQTITLSPATKTTSAHPTSDKNLALKTSYVKNIVNYSAMMKRKPITKIALNSSMFSREKNMLKLSTKTYSRFQKTSQKDVSCPSPPKQVHLETHNKKTLDEDSVVPEDIPSLILECTSTESSETMSHSLSQGEKSNCLSPFDRLVLECTSSESVQVTIKSRSANNCSPSQNNGGVVASHLYNSKSLLQCSTLSTGNSQFQKNFEEMNGRLSPKTSIAKNAISESLDTTTKSLQINKYFSPNSTSDLKKASPQNLETTTRIRHPNFCKNLEENLPSGTKVKVECTTPEPEEVTQRQSMCQRSHEDILSPKKEFPTRHKEVSLSPKGFPRNHEEDTVYSEERSFLEMTNQRVSSTSSICSVSQKDFQENENISDNYEIKVECEPLELLETIDDVCLSPPRSPEGSECLLPNDGFVLERTTVEISDESPTVYTWSLKNLEDKEYLISDDRPVLETNTQTKKTSCSQSHQRPQDYDKCLSSNDKVVDKISIKPINTKTLSNKINKLAQKNNDQVAEIPTDGEFVRSPLFDVIWNNLHYVQMPCDSWGFHRIKTNTIRVIAFSQVVLSDDNTPITVKHMCINEKMELVTYILKRRVNFEEICGLSDVTSSSCTIQRMVTALRSYRESCEGLFSADLSSIDDEVIFHVENSLKCFHNVQVTIGKYVPEGKNV